MYVRRIASISALALFLLSSLLILAVPEVPDVIMDTPMVQEPVVIEEQVVEEDAYDPQNGPLKANIVEPGPYTPTRIPTRGTAIHTILSYGFEGTSLGTGWVVRDQNTGATYKNDTWNITSTHYRTGSKSANCSGAGHVIGDYPTGRGTGYDNDMDAWMTYGPFDLRGCKNATFTFYYWSDVYNLATIGDRFMYGCSRNNSVYTVYTGAYQSTDPWQTSTNWNYVDCDLIWKDDFDGNGNELLGDSSVWIGFIFQSNASICGDAGYNGTFVDDVVLQIETTTPTEPTMFKVDGIDNPASLSLRRIYKDQPVFTWQFNDPDKTPYNDYQSEFCLELDNETDWFDAPKATINSSLLGSVNGAMNSLQYPSTASPLADGEKYYVRIKCRDGAGNWGPWGYSSFYTSEFNFTTNDDPSPPTLETFNTTGILVSGGDSAYINWTISENVNDTDPDDTILIDIYYSDDAGSTWNDISSDEVNDGTYFWPAVPLTVESSDCMINVTAKDGYEETYSYSQLFTIDNLAPTIEDINVTSDLGFIHVESMDATGGLVWYNSAVGMGDGQTITVQVNWTDANPIQANGTSGFGGQTPQVMGVGPSDLDYTVSSTDLVNYTIDINVSDGASRYDTAVIEFKVDNEGPSAVGELASHADSFADPFTLDNDTEFFVTWSVATDEGVGLDSYLYATHPVPDNSTTDLSAIMNATNLEGNTTAYVRAVDVLGNLGPVVSVNISVDTVPPTAPIVTSPTHPTSDVYYSEWSPIFVWEEPADMTSITGYSWAIDQTADTEPDEVVDTTNRLATFVGLLPGTYYFHVKAKDTLNWWGNASHYKFLVDNHSAQVVDMSDTTAFNDGEAQFKFLATDEGTGIDLDNSWFYYKFYHEDNFTRLAMVQDIDNYTVSVDIPRDSGSDLHYYVVFNDTATEPNSKRFPASSHIVLDVIDNILPTIDSVTGDAVTDTGVAFNLTVTASDNVDLMSATFVNDITGARQSMKLHTGARSNTATFYYEFMTPTDSIDPIQYHLEILDTSGNMVRSPDAGSHIIQLRDGESPWADGITGDTAGAQGGQVEIRATPYDNIDNLTQIKGTLYVGEPPIPVEMTPFGTELMAYINVPITSGDLYYYLVVEDRDNNSVRYPTSTTKYLISVPRFLSPAPSTTVSGEVNITYTLTDLVGFETAVSMYHKHETASLWTPIRSNAPNTGYMDWNTNLVNEGNTQLKMFISFTSFSRTIEVEVISGTFTVSNPNAPSLTVSTPVTGREYSGEMQISWNAMDRNGDDLGVSVYYGEYEDGVDVSSISWMQIDSGLAATGSVTLNTLDLTDGQYMIKVVADELKFNGLSNITVVGPITVANTLSMTLNVTNDAGKLTSESAYLTWTVFKADGVTRFDLRSDQSVAIQVYLRFGNGQWEPVGNSSMYINSYTVDMTGRAKGDYTFKVEFVVSNGLQVEKESGPYEYKGATSSGGSTAGSTSLIIIIIVIVAVCLLLIGLMALVLMRRKSSPAEQEQEYEAPPMEDLPPMPEEDEGDIIDDGEEFEVPAPPDIDPVEAAGDLAIVSGPYTDEPMEEMPMVDTPYTPVPDPKAPAKPVGAAAVDMLTAPQPATPSDAPQLPPAEGEKKDSDMSAALDDLFSDI